MAELEQVGQVVDQLFTTREPDNTVPCRNCGANVLVERPDDQWTLRCPACGQKITLTRAYRERRGFVPPERDQSCIYCRGLGVVEVPQQLDERTIKFGYRCICAAGQQKRWRAWPSAAGVDLAPLLRQRMERPLGGVSSG